MKKLFCILLAAVLLCMPLSVLAGDINTSEKRTYENADTVLPYRLILPENYDETKTYPMLVFLHGAGERGNDNELQFFHCVQYLHDNMPECIIVAPQCPANHQWVDTPWANGAYSIDAVPESNELKAVVELLQSLEEEFSVDSDRIYAAGISMGGFGTWDLMMRHNDYFAAGIPVCGGGDPSQGESLKDTPLYVFHGDADPAVPISGSTQTVDAIKEAGGTKVEYMIYQGAGHGIWNTAFQMEGLLDKLLAQKLSDRYPTEESVEESSEAESSEEASSETPSAEPAVSETESESEDGENGLLIPILLAAAVLIVVAVAAVLVVKAKKR